MRNREEKDVLVYACACFVSDCAPRTALQKKAGSGRRAPMKETSRPLAAAHLAARVHTPDRAHERRLAAVGAEAVAARDAAEEREQVADARDGKRQPLRGQHRRAVGQRVRHPDLDQRAAAQRVVRRRGCGGCGRCRSGGGCAGCCRCSVGAAGASSSASSSALRRRRSSVATDARRRVVDALRRSRCSRCCCSGRRARAQAHAAVQLDGQAVYGAREARLDIGAVHACCERRARH